jgi:hypothetical protein
MYSQVTVAVKNALQTPELVTAVAQCLWGRASPPDWTGATPVTPIIFLFTHTEFG